MTTEIATLDPNCPDPAVIARAAGLVRAGRLVAFPTETVYGLGANALDPAAVRRIFWAKGRPSTNPIIVHLSDTSGVANVASAWPETAARLAARFWPGPLTIVVPKHRDLPDEVTATGPTVAVRCPSHPVAQALLRAAGVPLAAPSANRSTELSPTRAEHVLKSLGGRIDLILDGGPCPGGIESTVVDVTGTGVQLLRPGQITVPMLEAVVGQVATSAENNAIARSPGQMPRHYSPRTRLMILDEISQAKEMSEGKNYAVLTLPTDPIAAAAELFAELHRLDECGHDLILVQLPPDTPEWAAVRDRLSRAASK